MRVLILGGRAPVALDHARRFQAQGWQTLIADSVSCRTSGWSNAVDRTFRLPSPRFALLEFAKQLKQIISTERVDLILPTCEEIFYVSRIRARLPATCNVFVAPFEQLRMLHSKWTFLSLAQGWGVDVPESQRVETIEEARDWACGRPVVLKPEFSRFGVHLRVYVQGIPTVTEPLPGVGPWIAQVFRRGREYCSCSIAVAGRLSAHVVYEPKHRLVGSSSYYFEPVAIPRIEAFVERFVQAIAFTGQISFDWIHGPDGLLSVIECNPRAISGLHLFSQQAALPAAITEIGSSDTVRPDGIPRMIAAVMLGVGLPSALRARNVKSWFNDWQRAKDVITVSADSKPALGALADIAAFSMLAAKNHSSLRATTTRDIEWDGESLEA